MKRSDNLWWVDDCWSIDWVDMAGSQFSKDDKADPIRCLPANSPGKGLLLAYSNFNLKVICVCVRHYFVLVLYVYDTAKTNPLPAAVLPAFPDGFVSTPWDVM